MNEKQESGRQLICWSIVTIGVAFTWAARGFGLAVGIGIGLAVFDVSYLKLLVAMAR